MKSHSILICANACKYAQNGSRRHLTDARQLPFFICQVILPKKLHRYKYELQAEQRADDSDHDVFLFKLSCEDAYKRISDGADSYAVGNRVSQRHHDERQESRRC